MAHFTPAAPQQSPSAGKREQTKIKNRQIILDAARQVFSEIGYGAATVRDIIRATPLASGTFYNYFKSKEEVYQAIRDEVALAIRPRLREGRNSATTVEEFIRNTFQIYFEYVAREKANYRSLSTCDENSRLRLDTPEVIAGFDELREDVERAVAKGLLPAVNTRFLMAAIVGTSLEIGTQMLAQEPPDPQAATEFAYALFTGGTNALPHAPAATDPETPPGGTGHEAHGPRA